MRNSSLGIDTPLTFGHCTQATLSQKERHQNLQLRVQLFFDDEQSTEVVTLDGVGHGLSIYMLA
jgi:hypothetical protein